MKQKEKVLWRVLFKICKILPVGLKHKYLLAYNNHSNHEHRSYIDHSIGTRAQVQARHKSCFLRPDTGPCRAEIIQWYFDVRQRKCYRFFWGGCHGNGNRFETLAECQNYCVLNTNEKPSETPQFCNLAFDYGTCFGYYNRWAWDRTAKSCRRRLYSGCGGNQNNFQSSEECIKTCLIPPNNTLHNFEKFTTCISFHVEDVQ